MLVPPEVCGSGCACAGAGFSGAGVAQTPTGPGRWGGRTLVGPLVERNVAQAAEDPACGLWVGGRSCQLALQCAVTWGFDAVSGRTDGFLAQKQNPESGEGHLE